MTPFPTNPPVCVTIALTKQEEQIVRLGASLEGTFQAQLVRSILEKLHKSLKVRDACLGLGDYKPKAPPFDIPINLDLL